MATKCFVQLQYVSYGSLDEEDDPLPVMGFRGVAIDNSNELVLPTEVEPVFGQFCDVNVYANYNDSVTTIRADVTAKLRAAYDIPLMTCIFLDVPAVL